MNETIFAHLLSDYLKENNKAAIQACFRQVPSDIFLAEALEVNNEFALDLWQKENGPLPEMGGQHSLRLFPVETMEGEQSIDRPKEISDLNLSLDELICIDSRQLKALGNVTIA